MLLCGLHPNWTESGESSGDHKEPGEGKIPFSSDKDRKVEAIDNEHYMQFCKAQWPRQGKGIANG